MVRRWGWAVGAAWLVDGLVLVKFPVLGVGRRLGPGGGARAGGAGGPAGGAKGGGGAGGLLWICGGSASQMAILALLGGMAGEVVHKNASKWGKWLASIPLLVGAEALVVGVHWLGGVALAESVWLAGMEVGLEIVVTMLLCIWKRQ